MKCQTCDNDNPVDGKFCGECGTNLISGEAIRRGFRRAIKVWLLGSLLGLATGLSFTLVEDALTTDLVLDLWELGIVLVVPLLMAALVALATRSKIGILLAITFLTLVMPVCSASFGATGSEPLWHFAALGLVGGLVWSTPFALWQLTRRR
jgi:hypothetical protein